MKDYLKSESSKAQIPMTRGKYDYTQIQIGKYAAENGPTRATKHFSQLMSRNVTEPTARN